MNFVQQYLLQLNTEKRRWQRAVIVLTALSILVAFVTVWNLRLTGITQANSASCGIEEHSHTDQCPADCSLPEHIHVLSCYSDPSADVETAADWEATLPDKLSLHWADNLVLVAKSQLGYQESEKNYVLADDGQTRQGYTRYGQWYGNPHGDWSSMFLAFCMNYANIPRAAIPWSPGVANMLRLCEDEKLLSKPDAAVDAVGNILFLDTDDNGNADKILIVIAAADNKMLTIGGDWQNQVAEITIAKDDPRILHYIKTCAVEEAYLLNIPMYSVSKNNNIYTVDILVLPVDYNGNRITELSPILLESLRVNSTQRITVSTRFDGELGAYHSAYFGTETSVSVDQVAQIWRYKQSNNNYYLAYALTDKTENQRYLNRADSSISLYLRYTPEYIVTFASEGFDSVIEYVGYKGCPTETTPAGWTREGYTLVGFKASDNQNIYSFEDVLAREVTQNVTYTAVWRQFIHINFDLGEFADELYPIESMTLTYGSKLSPQPVPGWKNNTVAMAFDGWYLDSNLTQPVTADYVFYDDATLYAKWKPKDEGYFIYFMDFFRDGQTPLVLVTYSVTEGHTASAYTPANAPEGTQWNGKWYLDSNCVNAYNFAIPVSQMTDYLVGASGRDLYLYPGTQQVCRGIFITYGTRIDPVTVSVGETINLDQYKPTRDGYVFAGWTLKDGTPVSGRQVINEDTTFYAKWEAGYVPLEAILRIENANDTGMTQADVIGTWYALSGSQIRVNSTYTGTGNNRVGTHRVVCVLNGKEYPVYTDEALTRQATLSDTYATYFIYNNTGTSWTDEINWDDVYTGGQLPYSTRPISSAGDTIINFDYMRVRNDVTFTIPNSSTSGAYLDIFKLYQNGLITGSVTYTGTVPTTTGKNVSATGVSGTNVRWTYTAATNSSGNNTYTLHDMKYGQRIYEVYPVGSSWLTARGSDFHWYRTGSDQLFSSRRADLSSDFFSGSGRKVTPYSLKAEFANQNHVALMYAVECLPGETPDFTINGVGYRVDPTLCEIVNHTGDFSIKELMGCEDGINPLANQTTKYYSRLNSSTAKVGGTSVKELFGTTYWDYYKTSIGSLSEIDRAYIFYYNRMHMNLQFSFMYDSNDDGVNDTVTYENIAFGEKIDHYQFGAANFAKHPLLTRDGYEFAGWLDANGFIMEAEDWDSVIATGDDANSAMIFIAKWEKISNNIVEYYEDVSAKSPFESHYFDDGSLIEYPTMAVYPDGWVWQEAGAGLYDRFDWDVPMYGEYGVQETRLINGVETVVNVIRIYGVWDESHTKVVYDPNAAQGGVAGTAPLDPNEYTIWQSEVSVQVPGGMTNAIEDMYFVGWLLDRDGIVYHPGDHVSVRWPRTMIFTAQWAKREEIVYLRYDPNGGTPTGIYPSDMGFNYRKNATAAVWDNVGTDGKVWFSRPGYIFLGWNTEPDGSGTAYAPNATITLTQQQTTLYAQWERDIYSLSLYKVDSVNKQPLAGAIFGLYAYENGTYRLVTTLTSGTDGHIIYTELQTDVLYKLVEERPPDGFTIITREIYFKVTPGEDGVLFKFCDSSGKQTNAPPGITGEYALENKLLTMTAENLRGYALPSTGGIGTPIYMLCGLALIIAPLVYSFSLRRRYGRRSKM